MDKHKEDDFVDFYIDRNIPVMISSEGPKAAVGDVNKDGLPDIISQVQRVRVDNYICSWAMDFKESR